MQVPTYVAANEYERMSHSQKRCACGYIVMPGSKYQYQARARKDLLCVGTLEITCILLCLKMAITACNHAKKILSKLSNRQTDAVKEKPWIPIRNSCGLFEQVFFVWKPIQALNASRENWSGRRLWDDDFLTKAWQDSANSLRPNMWN